MWPWGRLGTPVWGGLFNAVGDGVQPLRVDLKKQAVEQLMHPDRCGRACGLANQAGPLATKRLLRRRREQPNDGYHLGARETHRVCLKHGCPRTRTFHIDIRQRRTTVDQIWASMPY